MKLPCQFAISRLNFVRRRIATDAQDLVVVFRPYRYCSSSISLSQEIPISAKHLAYASHLLWRVLGINDIVVAATSAWLTTASACLTSTCTCSGTARLAVSCTC